MAKYPLTPVQKRIIKEAGVTWTCGDDNDFSCLLSTIMLRYYKDGHSDRAWQCFQNDPMALSGVSFDSFCQSMDESVKNHEAQQQTQKAHENACYID